MYSECPQKHHPKMSSPPSSVSECPLPPVKSNSLSGHLSSSVQLSSSGTSDAQGVSGNLKPTGSDHITYPIMAQAAAHPRCTKLSLLIIEGCHGVGKSTLVKKMKKKGYHVFIENFDAYIAYAQKTHPEYNIHDQLHFAQLGYVFHMKEEILKAYVDGHQKMVLDRFLLSTLLYSINLSRFESYKQFEKKTTRDDFSRFSLHQVLAGIAKDLSKYCEFHYEIFIPEPDKKELLFQRIKKRLILEPWRVSIHEDNHRWTQQIIESYEHEAEHFLYLIHGSLEHIWFSRQYLTESTLNAYRFVFPLEKKIPTHQ